MIDLRCGDWREVLADVECDALICDPPYGARTHAGHDRQVANLNGAGSEDMRNELCYASMSPADVREFVDFWSPRTRTWMAVMSCSDLYPIWREEFDRVGRYAFAPVPCVIRGMGVRMSGDGPSSWAVYLSTARPKTKEAYSWGTLPGAYVTTRGGGPHHIGGKPPALMSAIVSDYSRPGDLVCDPFSGGGTTATACESLGRRFVGSEIDRTTHALAMKRIARGVQIDMFGGAA